MANYNATCGACKQYTGTRYMWYKHKALYRVTRARKTSVRSMYDWMYASVHSGVSDLYLTRKLDKFLSVYK